MKQNTIIVIKNEEGTSLVDHCAKVVASWSCLKRMGIYCQSKVHTDVTRFLTCVEICNIWLILSAWRRMLELLIVLSLIKLLARWIYMLIWKNIGTLLGMILCKDSTRVPFLYIISIVLILL